MRKIVLSIFAVLMVCLGASAQNLRITGTVTDQSGQPVLAATVAVVGTTTATITDYNGMYEVQAPADAKLEISFVGLATQVVEVAGRTQIDVVLQEDAQVFEELVIVGYGSGVEAKSLVGSVSSVKGEKIANAPVANVSDVLQGKIPGLQVFTSSGEPAAGSTMMMRGTSSFNADTEPLIILDGAPVSSAVFTNLNSNDIESVVLLKDAASTSIYGARAANGVLYVTTKKGRRDQSVIRIGMQGGFSSMIDNTAFELMTAQEQMRFEMELHPELQKDNAWMKKLQLVEEAGFSFDWKEYAYNSNAPVLGTDASISGSSGSTNYYISFGYLDTEGIAPRSGNTRYTFRTNLDSMVRDWLKVGMNIGLTYSKYQISNTGWSVTSVDTMVYGQAPYNAPYEVIPSEDYKSYTINYDNELKFFDWMGEGIPNPYYYYEKFPSGQNSVALSGNTFFEVRPIEGLVLKAVQAIDASDGRGSAWRMPSYENTLGNGIRQETFSRYYQLTATNTAEYKFSIDDTHNISALIGQEAVVAHSDSFGVGIEGLVDDRLTMMTAGVANTTYVNGHSMVDQSYNSVFGRATYNYDGRYHLDVSLRADGSSKFGRNKRWGTFWSIGGMWNMKREEFMLGLTEIQDMRLKASYGTTGNSGIGNYIALGLIGAGPEYNGQSGTGISNPENPDLTWEVMKSFNIGISARAYNRMNIELEFYNRVTDDMLMSVPFSATTGFSSGMANVGKMRNRGFDFDYSYDLFQSQDMLWTIHANVSYNNNKILALYGDTEDYVDGATGLRYAVGHAVGEFSGVTFAGVDSRDGMPMWYDKQGNKTKVYSDSYEDWYDRKYIADWSGGFGTQFIWGNLSIGADFSWVGERWMWLNEKFYTANLNFGAIGQSHYERRLLKMWREPGDVTDIPKAGTPFQFDDTAYSNAAFLRLKNLNVSYDLPQSVLNKAGFIKAARVYAIGRNLWTLTNYLGFDPEYFANGSQGTYPGTRQYTFGLELSF